MDWNPHTRDHRTMGSLLLYIPKDSLDPQDGKTPGRATIEAMGAAELLGASPMSSQVRAGPDGLDGPGGWVMSIAGDAAPAFHGDRQVWRSFEGERLGSAGWFGWPDPQHPEVRRGLGGPPTPEQLVRSRIIPGHAVRLGDGREWIIPVARNAGGVCTLPIRMARERNPQDGQMRWVTRSVHDRHAALWGMAQRVWDTASGEGQMSMEEAAEMACRALAENYRICPALIEAMELFTTETYREVLYTLIDIQTIRRSREIIEGAEAKKKDMGQEGETRAQDGAAGSNTGHGDAAGCRDTPPRGLTSCGSGMNLEPERREAGHG